MNDYTETVGDLNAVTSNHPVLTNLKSRIAELENANSILQATADKLKKNYDDEWTKRERLSVIYQQYKDSLKSELLEVAESYPNDKDIIVDIANRMSIELSETKTYEVNVTFNIEICVPFGEDSEPNLDYDFDFSVDSSVHEIQGYDSDVVYGQEA